MHDFIEQILEQIYRLIKYLIFFCLYKNSILICKCVSMLTMYSVQPRLAISLGPVVLRMYQNKQRCYINSLITEPKLNIR